MEDRDFLPRRTVPIPLPPSLSLFVSSVHPLHPSLHPSLSPSLPLPYFILPFSLLPCPLSIPYLPPSPHFLFPFVSLPSRNTRSRYPVARQREAGGQALNRTEGGRARRAGGECCLFIGTGVQLG